MSSIISTMPLGEYDIHIDSNVLGNKVRQKNFILIILAGILSFIALLMFLWGVAAVGSCAGCEGCVMVADSCQTCDGQGCGTYFYNKNREHGGMNGDRIAEGCVSCISCY